MAEEKSEIDKLVEFLSDWGMRNEFSFVLPSENRGDGNIDFININLKTKTIYGDELNVDGPLTEVG